MDIKTLKEMGVRQNGKLFCVEDIKEYMPDFKVDVSKVFDVEFGGEKLHGVGIGDIHPLTEFDKMMNWGIRGKPINPK